MTTRAPTPQRIPLERHNTAAIVGEYAKRPDSNQYRLHVENDQHGNTIGYLQRDHLRVAS